MSSGTVILLNGASSAGKSSIARELQTLLAEPYLHLGIDSFLQMLPRAYSGIGPPFTPKELAGMHWIRPPAGQEELGIAIGAGPFGRQLIQGYHAAVRAMAAQGLNLIVDEVLLQPAWLDNWLDVLEGLPVLFAGVRCPLTVLERRERERGDRQLGQTRWQFERVHQHQDYDIDVDSSLQTASACATAISRALAAAQDQAGNAFARLRRRRRPD